MALDDVIRYEKAGVAGEVIENNPETALSLINSFYNERIKEMRESDNEKKKDKAQKDLEIGLKYPLTIEGKALPEITNIFSGRFKEAEEDTYFTDLFKYYAKNEIAKLDKEKKDNLNNKLSEYKNIKFNSFNARANASKAMKQLKDTGYSDYNFNEDSIKEQEEKSKEYIEQLMYLQGFKKLRFDELIKESIPSNEEQREKLLDNYLENLTKKNN